MLLCDRRIAREFQTPRIAREPRFTSSRDASRSLLDPAFGVAVYSSPLKKLVLPDPIHWGTDRGNPRSVWSGLTAGKRSPHKVGWNGNNGRRIRPEWAFWILLNSPWDVCAADKQS